MESGEGWWWVEMVDESKNARGIFKVYFWT